MSSVLQEVLEINKMPINATPNITNGKNITNSRK